MKEQLWDACADGEIEEVRKLLRNSQINNSYQDEMNNYQKPLDYAFFIACINGQVEVAELLLNDSRVDVNNLNRGQVTPFWIACQERNIEIIELLLNDERVDINLAESRNGTTPLFFCCSQGYIEIVKLLLNDERLDVNKSTSSYTPLWIACQNGHIDIVKLLLNDERVDVNKADNHGPTPFYLACSKGQIDIVRLLFNDQKVDVNKPLIPFPYNTCWTPFYIACESGYINIVLLFLENSRVDKNVKLDENGQFTLTKAQGIFEMYKTQRNQRLISTSKIQEITKEAEDFSTFQIYFLPFQKFLELEKIPKHEECQDKLINFTFEQMKETTDQLVFISHRWLSQNHPDPHSEQLNAIKNSFRLDPNQHRILIWYDYFSMPQYFDEDSKQKRVATIYRLNQIVTFSDSFLVLPTEDYFHRCWCFYEWSAAVFTGQKIQFYPNKFQTSEESLSFLSKLISSFHDDNDQPSKDQFIQKFVAFIETDKNLVWDNLMKVYDEETIIRYKKKLDTTQVKNWTIDEVCSWLDSIQFSQHQDVFREHKINGPALFNLYFEHQILFQNEDYYQKFLKKLEILIPIETWNEIDFSLWFKLQNWIGTKITQECCGVIEKLKLSPKAILKDKKMEGKILKEFLISELLGNVLTWKCRIGSTDNFSWYLDGPLKDIININSGIETPFFITCDKGYIEIVKLLLNDERVDINKADDYGATPFYIACYNGHIEIVKLLLNNKRVVDINKAENSIGATPFYVACEHGHIEIVRLLLNDSRVELNKGDKNYNATPFWIVCSQNQVEVVKLLLNSGRVDVNKAKNNGKTPFCIACYYGHIEIVKLLLNDKRVDVNKAGIDKETPFHIACSKGFIEIVKYILASGREVDLSLKNNEEKTAIEYAREKGKGKQSELRESEEEFQIRKENCPKIVELLELFERNPNEIRTNLRIQFGLPDFFLDEEETKIKDNQEPKENSIAKISKESTYQIEYTIKTYKLKTTATTLTELKSDIRTTIKQPENVELILKFRKHGKLYPLNDIGDLEEEMTIKVSTS